MQNTFYLSPSLFTEKETLILENGSMKAYAFAYSTGVAALRVENKNGFFIILPYQGQQIWRAEFLGQPLVMRTMFEEPVPTQVYLETYGGFLLHCGVLSMGAPSGKHAQHGELPNAQYQKAFLLSGEDEKGAYIAVSGQRDYNVGFTLNYSFIPECRLYEDGTVLNVNVTLKNLRGEPLPYMYLCHINFRPIPGSELMYSTKYDKEHIKVHKVIPDTLPKEQQEALANYMDAVQENPALHHQVGAPGQCYNPEIVFAVRYMADENGRAYTMQKLPDGRAFYVSHPADVLPVGVRWISKTNDEESMGMVLPATAEHFGREYAEKNGQMKVLAPYSDISFSITAGLIEKDCAEKVEAKIKEIVK